MCRVVSLPLLSCLSLLLVACESPSAGQIQPGSNSSSSLPGASGASDFPGASGASDSTVRVCAELLAAEPHQWTERMNAVYALGPVGSPHLVDGLAKTPHAPGAQAAIALLGAIGDEDAARHLEELVRGRGKLATEAALALGQLRASAAAATLLQCANDRFADATLRTAAACSAVRIGRPKEVATVLLGVMLAGTPAGQELRTKLGLPEKARWAHERYLIQRLLRDEAPEIGSFDTDASWPELQRAAKRLADWLLRD